jgi:uncharacterized membrane protein YgcG
VSTFNLLQNEHSLGIQIGNVSRILDGLEKKLGELDAELSSHSSQRNQYQLLNTVITSLDKLEEVGASDLFWDRQTTGYSPENQLRRARNSIAAFEHKIGVIQGRRSEVQSSIQTETDNLRRLNHELAELEDEAESLRHEFAIVRDAAEIPYRPLVMPWSKHGEDDRRYRKILLLTLLFCFVFTSGIFLLKPAHEKKQEEALPEHIAELVVKKKEEPKPVEKKLPEKSETTGTSTQQNVQQSSDTAPAPPGTPEAQNAARASAQTKGVLALKNDFAGLIDNSEPLKIGAAGRVSDIGQIAAGSAAQRALIVSQVSGGSGGINTSASSRQGTGGGAGGGGTGSGGGGQSITGSGVRVARVQSTTGAGVADDRPLSKGAGPSRTDEEIQIVFDRYKSALYRIYNRELRNNPSLRGKMVLRLTIEPDGRVSACTVKSTDLASPALSTEIVERVLKFAFGAKDGVPAVTILYPIDFLPAS